MKGIYVDSRMSGEVETMSDPNIEIAIYLLVAAVAGVVIGWLIRGGTNRRLLDQQGEEWQSKVDYVARQKDKLSADIAGLRSTIEAQQAAMHRHEAAAGKSRTELASTHEKTKSLTKQVFTLREERDEIKIRENNSQNALSVVKQQTASLQAEFRKAGQFYKGQLEKAFETRKTLEMKIDDAKLEHDSLRNLLKESRSEHESVNKMLASAQTRLGNLDAIEQNVIALEADNAQLRHSAAGAKQEIEALKRDVLELDELKIQNKELAHCLRSMENSRKQYEIDAKRYREHADQSENQSETLRIKLDDLEKNFSEIARQHDEALRISREKEVSQKSNGHAPAQREVDDLTAIVGVGKVFESTLHDLGIYCYRQIANFGVSDIARVNIALKEFKGRMEQDDWVAQAKELHFKKYGETEVH